jgi:hypothetical protein
MINHFKQISIILLLIICFSCKNDPDNQVRRPMYGEKSIDTEKSINSEDINSILDPDKFNNGELGQIYGDKTVDWSDGKTYTYDYIEEIESKDSIGNIKVITVYKRDKPTDGNCETKKCRWCSKEMNAEDYSIEEYPDINIYRGRGSIKSLWISLGSMIESMILSDSQPYFDLDNNKIRTEWRVKCDYGGPDGFCSMKCQSEYRKNSNY